MQSPVLYFFSKFVFLFFASMLADEKSSVHIIADRDYKVEKGARMTRRLGSEKMEERDSKRASKRENGSAGSLRF